MKKPVFALLASLFSGAVLAQAYPSKPIRIIIPFGAGSATDAVMRVLAPAVSATLGQQVVIDPKPGADGAISASEVARSAPDGYTLGVGSGGPLAAVPALRKNPPYDVVKDFTPITDIGRYTVFLFINASLPATNFQEFVALVKANPGKVAYGTGNPSGIVAWAQLNSLLGLDMLHVPYKTAPLVMPDLLANRVQALMDPPAVAISHVRDGKLRALATTLNRRSPLLPDVPTIHEAGVPQYTISNWMGLVGPAKLPREIVDRVNREFGAALRRPEVIEGLQKQAFMPNTSTPEQFAAFIQEQVQSYGSLLRAAGVKPD
ncbi:MAG: tripartite tricarboxylate transporter substrate binding protein [Alphaproteobacteria bacterium]|nr:tripartite tricarboxylate transporter substrate binding protein [Alphaproteobacteria bacterium]